MIDEQLRDDDSFVPAADDVSGGRCDDSQAGDALEVSEIAGCDREPARECGGADP
jgi:hypothetical protein